MAFFAEVTYPREAGFGIGIGSYSKIAVLESGRHTVRTTINSGTNNYGKTIYVFTNAVPRAFHEGDEVIVENVVCINLTQMFGAENEPTAEQFSAMFPANYYPYSEPTFMSFSSKEVISKGKNVSDIKNVLENSLDNQEALIYYPIVLRSNTKYTFSTPQYKNWNGSGLFLSITTKDKTIIETLINSNVPDRTHVTFSTANDSNYFLRFYKNNINDFLSRTSAYQLEEGENETSYAPYHPHITISTEVITKKYFPDGMKSAGSVHDELDLERGVAIQNIAAIDLESLSWTYDAINYRMFSDRIAQTVKKPRVEDNWGYHLSCAEYLPMIWNESKEKFVTLLYTGRIYVKDARYSDAAAFKEAVSGIVLYYELAEPIETPITEELPADIEIEAGGSLTFVNDQGEDFRVPVSNQQT